MEKLIEKPCLKDQNEFPNDEVLSHYLGKTKPIWDAFLDFIKVEYPAFSTEWRYYNDGKNWLFKITQKKKTICWVSVCENMFRTTFYFPDRVEDLLKSSKLKQEFIDQFLNGKRYGKIRGLTLNIRKVADLEMIRILIGIKEKLK